MVPNFKKTVSIGALILLFAIILGYGYFRSRGVISGVHIVVDSIQDGQTLSDSLVTLHGTAKNALTLTINDRPILVDQKGVFTESLSVPVGYSVIKIYAEDKFGKSAEKLLRVVFKG